MIDKLRSIAIFSTVVDHGSFRAAASHLQLAPSRISAVVSQLEAELGVTLLYRSTRRISLTNEGRILHARARDMLAAAETGLDAISPLSKEPAGVLRVTVPAFCTQTWLMDVFATFARTYEQVELDIHFSDRSSDVIADGFDVAIRAGWLEDSGLLSRKIGHAERLLVASTEYVSGRPRPEAPQDLESWDWIRFSVRPAGVQLVSPSGETVSVTGASHVQVNSASALYEFARRGLGLSAIPEDMARPSIERGEFVHVLPDWSLTPLGFYAVWPDQSRRENLTLLFVRFLADY